jgi:hypothetical protein
VLACKEQAMLGESSQFTQHHSCKYRQLEECHYTVREMECFD